LPLFFVLHLPKEKLHTELFVRHMKML